MYATMLAAEVVLRETPASHVQRTLVPRRMHSAPSSMRASHASQSCTVFEPSLMMCRLTTTLLLLLQVQGDCIVSEVQDQAVAELPRIVDPPHVEIALADVAAPGHPNRLPPLETVERGSIIVAIVFENWRVVELSSLNWVRSGKGHVMRCWNWKS